MFRIDARNAGGTFMGDLFGNRLGGGLAVTPGLGVSVVSSVDFVEGVSNCCPSKCEGCEGSALSWC